jgi:hypothetical protein
VDVNNDKEIKDIVADPNAVPPVEAVTETTVPWCFAYVEKEWMAGKKWKKTKENASPRDLAGNIKTTTTLLSCI